jgi:hypothetical protein
MHQPPPAVGRGVGDCAWSSTPPSATATYYCNMATATLPLISGGKLAYFSKKYEGLSFWIIHMHLWAVLA